MRSTNWWVGIGVLGGMSALTIWEMQTVRATHLDLSARTEAAEQVQIELDERNRQIPEIQSALSELQQQIAATAAPAPSEALPAWKSVAPGAASWADGYPFIDLPKQSLKEIQVVGLSFGMNSRTPGPQVQRPAPQPSDVEIAADVAQLLGMPETERQTAKELYLRMNSRFEEMARKHLAQSDSLTPRPARGPLAALDSALKDYVIAPFQQEAESLHQDWVSGLAQIIGPSRAQFLSTYAETISTPGYAIVQDSQYTPPPTIRAFGGDGPGITRPVLEWQLAGANEIRVDVTAVPSHEASADRVATSGFTNFSTNVRHNGSLSAGGMTVNSRGNPIPKILTPEFLAGRLP